MEEVPESTEAVARRIGPIHVLLGIGVAYVACMIGLVGFYSVSDHEFPNQLSFGLVGDDATARIIDEGGTDTIPPGEEGSADGAASDDSEPAAETESDDGSFSTSSSTSTTTTPTTSTTEAPTALTSTSTTEPAASTTQVVQSPVAPFVEIISPVSGSEQDDPNITITGKAAPGTRVFAGPFEADMDEDGNWSVALILSPGENSGLIKAYNDLDEVVATAPISVTLVAAPVEFSANQKYGESSEANPFDDFFGTTEPGTEVSILSDYGSATVIAKEDGRWFKKLSFNNPPEDQSFTVTIKAVNGEADFEFVFSPPDYPESVEFSAIQELGVNNDGWAYDYFAGTTNPGGMVTISSDYGSVSTEADQWGSYRKKLIFENLPPGKAIEVLVLAENGDAVFTFIWEPAD